MRSGLVTAAVLALGAAQHIQAQDVYIPERVATAVQQMQAPLVSTIKVSQLHHSGEERSTLPSAGPDQY